MKNKALKVTALLIVLFMLVVLYLQQGPATARSDSLPDGVAATNIDPASADSDVQHNSAAPVVANAPHDDERTETERPEGVESSTGVNDGTISLDEILSRIAISQDDNVFPQQYQVDIATTALLTDAISYLDKDELELHVFSAECYEVLNECRVHYQANDSLVLHLMGDFEGMSQIGDQITESGDTVLKIAYRPAQTQQQSRADN